MTQTKYVNTKEVGPGAYALDRGHEQLELPLNDFAQHPALPTSIPTGIYSSAFINSAAAAPPTHPTDPIYRPAHYASAVETIDAIEAWGLNYRLGNVVKYISRAGKKDQTKRLEDLRKALWYLQREIDSE